MQLEIGDMWSALDKTGLFLITTNSTVRVDGRLVMGRGIAQEAKMRFPGLDLYAGQIVKAYNGMAYGVVRMEQYSPIGLFQVKYHFADGAKLELIQFSTDALQLFIHRYFMQSFSGIKRIDLNFPGIGNGGLRREDVLPIISVLPDIVHIWERE